MRVAAQIEAITLQNMQLLFAEAARGREKESSSMSFPISER